MYFDDLNKKYIILDIEGNSAQKENERKITQFAALIIKDNVVEELNLMNRNVNYISPYVSKMTHISLHDCKNNGYSEKHLVEEIHRLLNTCDLIYAYGCDFDKNILKLMFKKYKLPLLDVKWFDVINDVKKYLNPTKTKLSIAANEYGFDDTNFHNALVDCYATYHLMKTIEQVRSITI